MVWAVMGTAILALAYAGLLTRQILSYSKGSGKMQEVWNDIKDGANAYLGAQFRTIAVLIVILKGTIATIAGISVGLPFHSTLLAGLALAQVGEFSFILAQAGLRHGLLSEGQFQLFLGWATLSMITTPFLIAAAPRLADVNWRRRGDDMSCSGRVVWPGGKR
jgi:hypothetical protein